MVIIIRAIDRRNINDGGLIRRWCLGGQGITRKSEWDVRTDLASGGLVEVLQAFSPEPNALHMVYPAGAVQPRRVRALMEFLVARLQ